MRLGSPYNIVEHYSNSRGNFRGIVEEIDEPLTSQPPEQPPEQSPEQLLLLEDRNLFGKSRNQDVSRILYGGDPNEINQKILDYERGVGSRSSLVRDEFPTYILISGHGNMIDCDINLDDCFTLLPRNYKLILSTKTGEDLVQCRMPFIFVVPQNATPYQIIRVLVNDKLVIVKLPANAQPGQKLLGIYNEQKNQSYNRVYEGLIPNHEINFNLVFPDEDQDGNPVKEIF